MRSDQHPSCNPQGRRKAGAKGARPYQLVESKNKTTNHSVRPSSEHIRIHPGSSAWGGRRPNAILHDLSEGCGCGGPKSADPEISQGFQRSTPRCDRRTSGRTTTSSHMFGAHGVNPEHPRTLQARTHLASLAVPHPASARIRSPHRLVKAGLRGPWRNDCSAMVAPWEPGGTMCVKRWIDRSRAVRTSRSLNPNKAPLVHTADVEGPVPPCRRARGARSARSGLHVRTRWKGSAVVLESGRR